MIYKINRNKPIIPVDLKNILTISGHKLILSLNSSHLCIWSKDDKDILISENLYSFKGMETHQDDEHLNNVIKMHHGVVPTVRSGIKEITYLHPGFSFNLNNNEINNEMEHLKSDIWTEDNLNQKKIFFNTLQNEINSVESDGILFSSGIDSVLIASLDQNNKPLYIWDSEPLQTEFAIHIAKKLKKKLHVVPYIKNNTQTSNNLRECFLGHSLNWNNGINSVTEFKGMRLLSGQNADTLLAVDTFAPGFNMIGARRQFNILKTIHKRIPYTISFQKFMSNRHNSRKRFLAGNLNQIFSSNNEHEETKFFGNQETQLPGIKNNYGFDISKASNENILFTFKLAKYSRFIVNVNRLYKEVEKINSIKRILPYSSESILKLLLNYVPSNKNIFFPKFMSYSFIEENELDYFYEKFNVLKHKLNLKHYLSRAQIKRSFIRHNESIAEILEECQKLNINLNEITKELEISNIKEKTNLMMIDRYLNVMRFKRSYFS